MTNGPPHPTEHVTEKYAEKLERFAESYGIAADVAEQAFRENCREIQGSFKDETPGDVIRRIALQKLERVPPDDPDGTRSGRPEYGIGVDAESISPRAAHE